MRITRLKKTENEEFPKNHAEIYFQSFGVSILSLIFSVPV